MVVVAAGDKHCVTVSAEGELFSWGFGEYCQLGLVDLLTPTRVEADVFDGSRVLMVDCVD
jgi:alpha-tubulin suppressor-like RCC1 family protein